MSKEQFKTKAQLNWEVGKEQQKNFKELLKVGGFNIIEDGEPYDVDELFAQIRQNEYRRGKEYALKLPFKMTNHEIGCTLECYIYILEFRGFTQEAKQLLEIASKLK